MKPLVVHTAKHPRCYRHLSDMRQAPVYWMTSKNGWMSSTLCKSWFLDCFVRDAKNKARELGLPFKVLLLMDNCPAHPTYLQDLHPEIQVVFLPKKTTSVIQPLDQEFIGTVKAIYQKHLYDELRQKTDSGEEIQQIIAEANADEDHDSDDEVLPDIDINREDRRDIQQFTNPNPVTVAQYWRSFTIKNAIDFLMKAWNEVNHATVRHAWRPLVPHLVGEEPDAGSLIQTHNTVLEEAAAVARQVPGFEQVTVEELREVNAAGDEMSAESIMDIAGVEDNIVQAESERQDVDVPDHSEISMQQVSRILAGADAFKECVKDNEVSLMRISEVLNLIDKSVRFYNDLHSQKVNERKQLLITRFTRPAAQAPAEPQPGPSHASDDDDDAEDFLGFEDVVREAERERERQAGVTSESESEAADDPPSASSSE